MTVNRIALRLRAAVLLIFLSTISQALAKNSFTISTHDSKSKPAVQLEVREVRVRTARKNASNNSFAGSVGNIERESRLRIELVLCAQIEDVGESFLAA